ncbi:hypothetical protein RIF29_28566 [Crotalaria pallida]|uniref:MI domain-containing protein n=1 Tax=Crotalaria pallida TaxID=3830 RepID=A0AAN9ECX9_CROPI
MEGGIKYKSKRSSSIEYQRISWDTLKKSINALVNKVSATNIKNIIPELFSENLIRGRGLFCRSCIKSQMASPLFTHVLAALVAVVNTKLPEVGHLLLRRLVLQLKRAYSRNDKPQLLAAVQFLAHLVNQQVAHEIIALELLTLLLDKPTDDTVEVAVAFLTQCGSILHHLSPKALQAILDSFRAILSEGQIGYRIQILIRRLLAIVQAKFQGYPAVHPQLDLVDLEDQFTHELSFHDDIDPEISLDVFKPDPNFLENLKRYDHFKRTILGEEEYDDDDGGGDDDVSLSDVEDYLTIQIKHDTDTNLINLRRTIYLTIMSSLDFEEAGHKLLQIKLQPGQEMELCIMFLECCSHEQTYRPFYALLGQRLCMINKLYRANFDKCFVQHYSTIHRLETNKLRNVAMFFAHLLATDALPWHVLSYIRLTEEDTTSSSRIFIKILFQELSEHLGIRLLNERLNASTESVFRRDNPKNTLFAINFFTSIGLGCLTENLRAYLKSMPRLIMQNSETTSTLSESASSSSDDSDNDERRRRKQRRIYLPVISLGCLTENLREDLKNMPSYGSRLKGAIAMAVAAEVVAILRWTCQLEVKLLLQLNLRDIFVDGGGNNTSGDGGSSHGSGTKLSGDGGVEINGNSGSTGGAKNTSGGSCGKSGTTGVGKKLSGVCGVVKDGGVDRNGVGSCGSSGSNGGGRKMSGGDGVVRNGGSTGGAKITSGGSCGKLGTTGVGKKISGACGVVKDGGVDRNGVGSCGLFGINGGGRIMFGGDGVDRNGGDENGNESCGGSKGS